MSDTAGWKGFKPDTSAIVDAVLPKKSPHDLLDELEEQLDTLEEKRKELLFEIAKEEVREDEDGTLHKGCASQDELEAAERDAEDADDLRDALVRFGGHAPACCQGALAGTQKLHRLCTCGWNEVATEIERQ